MARGALVRLQTRDGSRTSDNEPSLACRASASITGCVRKSLLRLRPSAYLTRDHRLDAPQPLGPANCAPAEKASQQHKGSNTTMRLGTLWHIDLRQPVRQKFHQKQHLVASKPKTDNLVSRWFYLDEADSAS